jgi:ABC-2 type transport system ATP-binding protein
MTQNPAIEAAGLIRHFGATRALDGLDLCVPAGGILGLLGPNGAGKTTAVRVLATLLRPEAGQARILGADVVRQAAQVRGRIGLTGQYAALDEHLTGRANLIMIGRLSRLTRRQARRRAGDLLDRFGLAGAAGRAVKTYSGGMRRRLDLAAGLIGRPEVLFLDEPTTGLDPGGRAVMWQIIRELAADGTTLLLTTQYLDEADQLADRVAVMDAGRVIAEGTPDQLKARTGEERVVLSLAPGADLAAAATVLASRAAGPVDVDPAGGRVSAQVASVDGITTDLVRRLDTGGIQVTSVALHRPSLDDVFLTLTGHAAGPPRAGAQDQGRPGGRDPGDAGPGDAGPEDCGPEDCGPDGPGRDGAATSTPATPAPATTGAGRSAGGVA